MKIDLTSLSFNSSLSEGVGTPSWGTALGQSQGYNITVDGAGDLLLGMFNNRIDPSSLEGNFRGGKEILLAACFRKVKLNNSALNVPFILAIVEEHSDSHYGRKSLKYNDKFRYSNNVESFSNEEFYRQAQSYFGTNSCWFAYEISVVNETELNIRAVKVSDEPSVYVNSKERKAEWANLISLSEEKKLDSLPISVGFLSVFTRFSNLSGLVYSQRLVSQFISSLLTKPFVILTGLSGSGKTKLAQAFVKWICQDKSQFRIIPVGADWTNREPLLGYPNALNPKEYVKPDSGVLDLIIQANNKLELPHFLILDEMNLSHVERYFADFLSVIESNDEIPLYEEGAVENGVPSKLRVPSNLFFIGTVNIDETTNMFSPKVLDRANTIEFRVTKDEMKDFLGNIREINMDALTGKGAGMAKSFLDMAANKDLIKDETINDALVQFFGELKKTGAEFGYRSATEILRLIHQLTVLDAGLSKEQKIDIAIMQKLLPKLHGSRRKLCPVLETLGSFCIDGDVKIVKDVFEQADFDFNGTNVLYPLSLEKISRMYRGAIDNGFASFAEA
jgi:hypothetical protein